MVQISDLMVSVFDDVFMTTTATGADDEPGVDDDGCTATIPCGVDISIEQLLSAPGVPMPEGQVGAAFGTFVV